MMRTRRQHGPSIPPPPVNPAQVPQIAVVAPQLPTSQMQIPQSAVPSVNLPSQIAGVQHVAPPAAPLRSRPNAPGVPLNVGNLPQPQYGALQNALQQAMQQQNIDNSTVTMEDLAHFLLAQGRSSGYYGGSNLPGQPQR